MEESRERLRVLAECKCALRNIWAAQRRAFMFHSDFKVQSVQSRVFRTNCDTYDHQV